MSAEVFSSMLIWLSASQLCLAMNSVWDVLLITQVNNREDLWELETSLGNSWEILLNCFRLSSGSPALRNITHQKTPLNVDLRSAFLAALCKHFKSCSLWTQWLTASYSAITPQMFFHQFTRLLNVKLWKFKVSCLNLKYRRPQTFMT